MAFANVFLGEISATNATDLRVSFVVMNSAGKVLSDQLAFAGSARGLGQLTSAVRAQVITWAATVAGGSLTLKPSEVWMCGLADDQVTGVRVSADAPTSNPAFIDVPNLQFILAPNANYKFEFTGAYTSAAATTGMQLSVNGPASPTFMRAVGTIYTAAATPFSAAIGSYDAPIAALNSGASTALPFSLVGTISTAANGGAFSLRFRTEVNGNAVTILRGSFGELVAIG